MVGLVIVSHSRALAEAACALARGVSQNELPVDFAGGAGDGRNELGTDATDIMEAITRVNSGDGVVVLMDLGSAVISARLAEQLLGGDVPGIRLCPAPLVEGAVAAAVQIAAGASVDAVCEEAKNALAGKYREMEDAPDVGPSPSARADDIPREALRLRFRIPDPAGMHLRPAARLVETLSPFGVNARIRNYDADGAFFNAASINQISLANICANAAVEIALWGDRAEPAMDALRALVRDEYGGRECDPDESASAVPEDAPVSAASPRLIRLAPGVAVGTLYIHRQNRDPLPPLSVADPEDEVSRLDAALSRVRAAIAGQREKMASRRAGDADIMAAQLLILDDPDLVEQVRSDIRRRNRDAASSYQSHMLALAADYRALDNPYLRERAADVSGVCDQVLDVLLGKSARDLSGLSDVVLWAEEATPDLLARWSPGQLRGVLTRSGAPTSHVAILAKAMGIPALAGYAPPAEAATGLAVAVDADRAEVAINPDRAALHDFEARRGAWRAETAEDKANSHGRAVTRDGAEVAVFANIGDLASAREAVENGAEGVGLLRTEFMFLDRARPPDEPEQVESLSAIFAVFGDNPVTVRTLDVGGDKQFAGLDADASTRSPLGVRGVRVYRKKPALFKTQIRAILQAAFGRNVSIMIPMIAVAEEVDFCRAVLEECHAELSAAGVPHLWPVKTGIMVETPAAALCAAELAQKADFFSIGTNDLTQYVMCAERGLSELAALADAGRPAVRKAIRLVAEAAIARGIPVAVCGEMAAEPAEVPGLLRLGIRHLSVNSLFIGKIKKTVRATFASPGAAK